MNTPDYISGYQTGYADKTVGKVSAYPPSPPAPAAPAVPPVTTIKPTDDIAAILKGLKGGEQLALIAGQNYSWPAPLVSSAAYTMIGNGANVTFPAALMGKGMNVCFWLSHAGTNISGLNLIAAPGTNYTAFRVYADSCVVAGNSLSAGFCNAALTDVGGTNFTFNHNNVGVTNSCSIFASVDGGVFANNFLVGSLGETVVRTDFTEPGKQTNPNNLIFSGNTVHTVPGNQKGCMEWRQAGTGCQCACNTFFDYVRIGQDNQTTANGSVGGIIVSSNTWPVTPTSVTPNQFVMVKNGIVAITGNTWPIDGKTVCVTGSGHAQITLSGNQRKLTSPLPAGAKPLPSVVADASCTVTDDNAPIV